MNIALWVAQGVLALVFLAYGIMKFVAPDGLPEIMSWVYDMVGQPAAMAIGIAEIAAAAGLILPGLTGIQPRLTALAALGLIPIMAGAILFHLSRDEVVNIPFNVLWLVMAAFVAYGRGRLVPLRSR